MEARASVAARLPPVMLWAWHGSHDLDFIDPAETGVAFLAGTIRIVGGSVALETGSERMRVPSGAVLLPVVRIEVEPGRRALLDADQAETVSDLAMGFVGASAPGLQLDFDATLSQRQFYLAILEEIRQALATRILSVTALPSWCLDDPWLPAGTIDEIVPMVYRMGPDAPLVRRLLASGRGFREECREAIGVAGDEEVPHVQSTQRLYLFSGEPWTAAVADDLLVRVKGRTSSY